MPHFSGKYYYTLDPKGRIIIPAPFREIIASDYTPKLIFVNEAFDNCLCAYPVDEWNRHVEEVRRWPKTLEEVRYYKRRVVGSAVECEIDKQGRVLIPAALRTDAGLDSEMVLIGQGHMIEVWDRKEFDEVLDPAKIDKKAYRERIASFETNKWE